MLAALGVISPWVWVVLGLLAVAELVLDVIALVDLLRRPAAGVVFERRWIWLAIILAFNLAGAVVYLVAGRKPPAAAEDAPGAMSRADPAGVADLLYGPAPRGGAGSR